MKFDDNEIKKSIRLFVMLVFQPIIFQKIEFPIQNELLCNLKKKVLI